VTAARRAAVALAITCGLFLFLFVGAGSDAFARSKKQRHHRHHKGSSRGQDGGSASDGRSHLKRANALAGEGDCDAAIVEYTKAFELLGDPVVLFNRAECYRRTGSSEDAVDDYRAFLDKVPNAPNRADIEAKIVALDAPEPSRRDKPADEPAPAPPKAAEAPPPSPPQVPAPKQESTPEPTVTLRRASVEEDVGPSGGSRPWVWIALSVLIVGAAVGGYLLLRPHDQVPPDSALGNYRL
jgi:hypothetical protein